MDVLSSRVLLYPADFERSVRFYGETLGLEVYREYGRGGRVTGVVFFLGGGFLEVTSAAGGPPGSTSLWLQVPDVDVEYKRLEAAGVDVVEEPADMPWGLREMACRDPDGMQLRLIEVPPAHPLRRRVD
jgi:predicted enzyme related to lactoylglutathione lyase